MPPLALCVGGVCRDPSCTGGDAHKDLTSSASTSRHLLLLSGTLPPPVCVGCQVAVVDSSESGHCQTNFCTLAASRSTFCQQ
eukprot:7678423-Karenia_brevis.AAC.1